MRLTERKRICLYTYAESDDPPAKIQIQTHWLRKTLQLAKFNYFKEQLPSLSEQ